MGYLVLRHVSAEVEMRGDEGHQMFYVVYLEGFIFFFIAGGCGGREYIWLLPGVFQIVHFPFDDE